MRSAAAKGPELAHAKPQPTGHFEGPDGRPYVSIILATHRKFARACLDELLAKEGKNQFFLLRDAKAISVPVAVLAGARERLGKSEGNEADD